MTDWEIDNRNPEPGVIKLKAVNEGRIIMNLGEGEYEQIENITKMHGHRIIKASEEAGKTGFEFCRDAIFKTLDEAENSIHFKTARQTIMTLKKNEVDALQELLESDGDYIKAAADKKEMSVFDFCIDAVLRRARDVNE